MITPARSGGPVVRFGERRNRPQVLDGLYAVIVPMPFGQTELWPVRALTRWRQAVNIAEGPVCRGIWLPRHTPPGEPPLLPRIGASALTPWAVAAIAHARAAAEDFAQSDFGGHCMKRGALTAGMECGRHPADLKRLGRLKSFVVLGEYLEFTDLFERHPLGGAVASGAGSGGHRLCGKGRQRRVEEAFLIGHGSALISKRRRSQRSAA
jgi:hypothetical protein